MRAALGFSEAQRPAEAERWLQEAVRREPALDRAWFNLGLLLAGRGNSALADAASMLERAQSLCPTNPEYSYALATVLLRQGRLEAAHAAAKRTLEMQPQHPGAMELLRRTMP